MLSEANTYVAQNIDQASTITITSLLARTYWQSGERTKAREAIESGVKTILSVSLRNLSSKAGFENISNTLLDILEEQLELGQPLDEWLLETGKKLLRASHHFADLFPVHTPSVYYSESRYLWLTGNPKAALVAGQKSLEFARLYHLPYAEGLALYELGRHTVGDERHEYLKQARAIFEKIKARYDLKRIPAA